MCLLDNYFILTPFMSPPRNNRDFQLYRGETRTSKSTFLRVENLNNYILLTTSFIILARRGSAEAAVSKISSILHTSKASG